MREKQYICFRDGQSTRRFSKIYHWTLFVVTGIVLLVFFPDPVNFNLELAYALLSLVVFNNLLTFLHEYIHKWTATLFGYKTYVEFRWNGLIVSGICHFDKDEYIKRTHFLITLLTPFISLITLLMFTLLAVRESFALYILVWLLIVLKSGGCRGDFFMVSEAFKKTTKGDKLRYTGDSTFEIFN